MKANELRIGNLVLWRTAVLAITTTDIEAIEAGSEKYRPIPITEEWHNKFGITKDGFGSFNYNICPFNKRSKVIVFSGDYIYLRDFGEVNGKPSTEDSICVLWNNDRRGVIPVHTFQNLCHALTGKELTPTK